MANPLSKRHEAELRAVYNRMGRAFAEFLMSCEEATTDWQMATAMIMRLQWQMPPADWERFAFAVDWPYGDIADDSLQEPERPRARRAAAKKPALH